MTQQLNSIPAASQDASALNFRALLALGAMLASLAVVAFACLGSGDSLVQARLIRQGTELILLVWSAGLIASFVRFGGQAQRATGFELPVTAQGESARG